MALATSHVTLANQVGRRITSVEIEPFYEDDEVIDRKIVVWLDCRHSKFVGIPLSAPVPVVGEASRCLRKACREALA